MRGTGCDTAIGIVRRPGTSAPQAEFVSAGATGQQIEPPRVAATAVCVEVRGGSAHRDKADVDVQPVAYTDYITEEPPVIIHQVGS